MMGNENAESAVIGCILMDGGTVMPEAVLSIGPEDFSRAEYRAIYRACLSLFQESRDIDVVTLREALSVAGVDANACMAVAVKAAEATPSIRRYREYLTIVHQEGTKRRAGDCAAALLEAVNAGEPFEDCRRKAAEVLRCFDEPSASSGTVDAKAGLLSFMDEQEQERSYISTGFSRLDRNLWIEAGDYIIIGGRPSAGKTALTLQMALHMSKTRRVLYFSLETSARKLYDRAIANFAMVPLGRIKAHALTDDDWQRVTQAYDAFSRLRLEVVPASGWTVEQIRAKAIQSRAEVVFIDYITLIQATGRTMLERATQISIALHTFSQQCGVAVFALSQLNREGAGNPDMTSIRESGQIEQDADAVLLLYQPDEDEAERALRTAKNKEGRTGELMLRFDGQHQRFFELETRHHLQEAAQ